MDAAKAFEFVDEHLVNLITDYVFFHGSILT